MADGDNMSLIIYKLNESLALQKEHGRAMKEMNDMLIAAVKDIDANRKSHEANKKDIDSLRKDSNIKDSLVGIITGVAAFIGIIK